LKNWLPNQLVLDKVFGLAAARSIPPTLFALLAIPPYVGALILQQNSNRRGESVLLGKPPPDKENPARLFDLQHP
jgi:hypothetical protein